MVELEKQDFNTNKKLFTVVENMLKSGVSQPIIIDHVGSTAIPNMCGKNIIDVLVGVADTAAFSSVAQDLELLGFHPSTRSKTSEYQFFASSLDETKSGDTHIHLVLQGTDRYREFILLRDYLLSHPDETMAYSNHKKHILATQGTNRTAYRQTKSTYVTALIEKSHIWKENK